MWLIKQEAAAEVARVYRTPVSPTAEQRAAFKAEAKVEPTALDSRVMKTAGSVAEIAVAGVLVKNMSFLLWLMGVAQTAYSDIVASLAKASADATIKSVVLRVDSPGGMVDGLFETLAAVQAFDKPISVFATQACSAAYALAAVAGKITAASPASSFGSIGVAADITIDKDVVALTSTEAPDKRPDVTTDAGKAVVVEYLDAVHDLFVEAIAKGRESTVSAVNSGFGRGAVVLAADAKSRGMIDAVVQPARANTQRKVGASVDAEEVELVAMDLRTLKASHPDIYDAAASDGVTAERKRVTAHLTMGATGGELGRKMALDAIAAGTEFDMPMMAQYQALALNSRDRTLRGQDEAAAAGAADGSDATAQGGASGAAPGATAAGKPAEEVLGDQVVAIMQARRGKKVA